MLRQGVLFVVFGVVQLLVDWAIFSVLFWLTGVATWTNVAGRAGGALLGFQLHGRVTFAEDGTALVGRERFLRYVLVWLGLTLLGTVAMAGVADAVPARWVYVAKPAVEVVLAVLSFAISRQWVFR